MWPRSSRVNGQTSKSPNSSDSALIFNISFGQIGASASSAIGPAVTPSIRFVPRGQIRSAGVPEPNAARPCTVKHLSTSLGFPSHFGAWPATGSAKSTAMKVIIVRIFASLMGASLPLEKVPLITHLRDRQATIAHSSMLASRPAARPPHSFFQLRDYPFDMLPPGLVFLDGYRPADPLVARQRSYVFPRRPRLRIGGYRLAQIGREIVYNSSGDSNGRHSGHLVRVQRSANGGQLTRPVRITLILFHNAMLLFS